MAHFSHPDPESGGQLHRSAPRQHRVILHVDGNNFFASCECLLRPELKEVPMAVAGDPESRHGIILAKNQLAKVKGVQTAEPIWQAQRKCPGLVLVSPHRDTYTRISRAMNQIFLDYTDLVEPASIDESYLDLTGSLHLLGVDAKTAADRIRARVRSELGITVSVGVSFCKVFAKLGSDYQKPDATTCFPPEAMPTLIWPMPVGNLLYVGGKFAGQLQALGIHTIGDLAHTDPELLRRKFGARGESAWRCANGEDTEPVRPYDEPREVKSIGNSITFRRNLVGERELKLGFTALAESVSQRMRQQQLCCHTLQIQIRDPNFRTISRQLTPERPLFLARELAESAMALAAQSWDFKKPVRLLSLTAKQLSPLESDAEQLSLFPTPDQAGRERQGKLEDALSAIRGRFGKDAIQLGGFLGNDLGLRGSGNKLEEDDKE